MTQWIEAPNWPKEWEGRQVWEWREDNGLGVKMSNAPRDYSRDPQHCGGIWWMLLEQPAPPTPAELLRSSQSAPSGNSFIAYTDGACSGNPGPGGWGVLIEGEDSPFTACGGETQTTNQIMELTAAIVCLRQLPEKSTIEVRTDSKYVLDGITSWIHGWKRNGWKNSKREPVKNADLWRDLDALNSKRNVTWTWVKGHAGNPGNEKADELAREGMAPYKSNQKARK